MNDVVQHSSSTIRAKHIRKYKGVLAISVFLFGAVSPDLNFPGPQSLGNIALILCFISSIFIHNIYRNKSDHRYPNPISQYFYLFYIALCASSAFWSTQPFATVVQSILLFLLLATVTLLSDIGVLVVVRAVLVLCAVLCVFSILSIGAGHDFAFQPVSSSGSPELRGVLKHQLRLGVMSSIGIGLLVIAYLNGHIGAFFSRRMFTLFVFIVALLVCVLAARARLYTAMMFVSLVLTIGISRGGWLRYTVYLLIGFSLVILYIYGTSILQLLEENGIDTTLTGRTQIWEKTLEVSRQGAGWLGFGYSSFDSPKFDYLWLYYRPPHAHNSYINAYFETGILGLSLIVILTIMHIFEAVRVGVNLQRYSYALFLVLFTFLGSLTGVNYAGRLSFLFVAMMIVLSSEAVASDKRVAWRRMYRGENFLNKRLVRSRSARWS